MADLDGIVPDPWLPVRWPEYREPASAVLALVQMPEAYINGERLSQACTRDFLATLRAKRSLHAGKEDAHG